MRKYFYVYLLVPIIIFFVIIHFFVEGWVETGIEESAQTVFGAKVEIDDLQISYVPVSVKWSKMQVANANDPWENLFETKEVKFEMDANQLLRKKYIIETVEVYGLEVGTKRTLSGALSEEEKQTSTLLAAEESIKKAADEAFKQLAETTPIFDLVKLRKDFKPDSLIKILDIKTIAHLDSTKNRLLAYSQQWNNVLNDIETSKLKAADIVDKIKAINPSTLNNEQSILAAIGTVDNSYKSLNEIKTSFDNRYASINMEIKNISSSINSIDDIIKRDFQNLKNMARLPSINTPSIANLLVGNEMYKRVMGYIGYTDMARSNVKKYSPEPQYEKKKRFAGQDIDFYSPQAYPKLWIKQIIIQGGEKAGSDFDGKGEVKNISDNQNITGEPITINLSGKLKDNKSISLTGLIDRRKDSPVDEYTANFTGLTFDEFNLGKSSFLPSKIKNAIADTKLKISMPGDRLDANIDFNLSNLSLVFESEPKNIFESIVKNVLTKVNAFNVNVRVWNTKESFQIALATDLDAKIASGLKEVVGEELAKFQSQLKAKFDSFIAEKRSEFGKIYNDKLSEVQGKLGQYQTLFSEQTNIVDLKKKELEDRLAQKKNKFINQQIQNLIKP